MRIFIKEMLALAVLCLGVGYLGHCLASFSLHQIDPLNSLVQVEGQCSGTVIEHKDIKYVLTAAHCVELDLPENKFLRTSTLLKRGYAPSTTVNISIGRKVRKGYIIRRGNIDDTDIALIAGNFDEFPALKVAEDAPQPKDVLIIYGLATAEFPTFYDKANYLGEQYVTDLGNFYYIGSMIVGGFSGGNAVNDSNEVVSVLVRGGEGYPACLGVRLDVIHLMLRSL